MTFAFTWEGCRWPKTELGADVARIESRGPLVLLESSLSSLHLMNIVD